MASDKMNFLDKAVTILIESLMQFTRVVAEMVPVPIFAALALIGYFGKGDKPANPVSLVSTAQAAEVVAAVVPVAEAPAKEAFRKVELAAIDDQIGECSKRSGSNNWEGQQYKKLSAQLSGLKNAVSDYSTIMDLHGADFVAKLNQTVNGIRLDIGTRAQIDENNRTKLELHSPVVPDELKVDGIKIRVGPSVSTGGKVR